MPVRTQTADGVMHEFADGTDQGVIDRVMRDYAQSHTAGAPASSPSNTAFSVSGTAAAVGRGAAPYAAGAAIGAGVGSVVPGVGTAAGAAAGVGATALSEFGGNIWNWLGRHTGLPEIATPQQQTDEVLDSLGVRRPGNTLERGVEAASGFAASMAGTPVTPKPSTAVPGQPQQLLEDFARQGVSPSVPTIGQGPQAARWQNLGKNMPVAGRAIHHNVTEQIGQTRMAADTRAGEYGTPRDPHDMGAVARNAGKRFAADTSQADADYGNFFRKMANAPPVAMTHTRQLLDELMGRFPNAPELVGWMTPPPIERAQRALEPKTVTTPAKMSKVLDPQGNPTVVTPAKTVTRGGVLSLNELQELRTRVGSQLTSPAIGSEGIPRAQLKRLYAAITRDLRNSARAQGPDALKALETATTNYGIRSKLIDRVAPLAEGEKAEAAFARLNGAAMDRGAADAGLLQAAKKIMTPEEWGDFGATVISRLGEPKPNQSDMLKALDFSVSSFMTNWGHLSEKAKDITFGPKVAGSPRDALESLARTVQAQRNIEKVANTSRSAEYALSGGLAVEALHAAWTAISGGGLGEAGALGLGAGVGYVWGKILTDPRFARWYFSLPKTRVVTPELVAKSSVNLVNALSAPQQEAPKAPERKPAGQASNSGVPSSLGIQPAGALSPAGMF